MPGSWSGTADGLGAGAGVEGSAARGLGACVGGGGGGADGLGAGADVEGSAARVLGACVDGGAAASAGVAGGEEQPASASTALRARTVRLTAISHPPHLGVNVTGSPTRPEPAATQSVD